MEIITTDLPGVLIIEPRVFGDERGFFLESYNKKRYAEFGIKGDFVQDNLSFSSKGVLRGLHFQNPQSQGKLVSVLQGEVFDVAVDIRRSSPTFGQHVAVYLSAENKRQFWIPAGFAHGFVVTSDTALFAYKCDEFYSPQTEHTLLWNDPELNIQWPCEKPTISEKDQKGLLLADFAKDALPK